MASFPTSFPSTKLRDLSSHHFKVAVYTVATKLQDCLGHENNTKFHSAFSSPTSSSTPAAAISLLYVYSETFCYDIASFLLKSHADLFLTRTKVFSKLDYANDSLGDFSMVTVSLV